MVEENVQHKLHIGDGVYVHFDGYHVVLETSNGLETTNEIFLEPEVIVAFQQYLTKLAELIKSDGQ